MIPKEFAFFPTKDGSGTLYSNEWNESYHSLNGALQESMHVFLDAGLKYCTKKQLHLFEVGFGTGLNALLTWAEAKEQHLDILYTAAEAYPLPWSTLSSLGYETMETKLGVDAFQQLHAAAWGSSVVLAETCFTLEKLQDDFTTMMLPKHLDLVYFDAFSPEKQPEMWEESLLSRLFENMNPDGILVTYCAKGEVRRRLQRSGFHTERIPGPPGKREMLRARKPNS